MSYAAIAATGRRTGAPPPFLDVRFNSAGDALPCAGNTIIGHIRPGPAQDALAAAVAVLRATEAGDCFAWLPAPSWHMTLFDGVLHDRRGAARWPQGLAADATPEAADAWMLARLRDVATPGESAFAMVPTALESPPAGGVWVALSPADAQEEARLRGWRDQLADATGLRHRPGHDAYAFHITLAYAIDWAAPAQADAFDQALADADRALRAALPRLTIGPPEICRFASIDHFEPMNVMGEAAT